MIMDTSIIDDAIAAASVSPVASAPAPVNGWPAGTEATIQTLPYRSVKGSGFQIIGAIKFANGYIARRVVDIGPNAATGTKPWPGDIESAVAKYGDETFSLAEKHLDRCGFSAVRLVSLLNLYLSAAAAAGNNSTTLAASRPKLVAVYAWTQQVQGVALQGSRIFPPAPHKFEEVMMEAVS